MTTYKYLHLHDEQLFPSLQFYSENKGSIATTLLKPKQKHGAKSAELELSKCKFHWDFKKNDKIRAFLNKLNDFFIVVFTQ